MTKVILLTAQNAALRFVSVQSANRVMCLLNAIIPRPYTDFSAKLSKPFQLHIPQ